MKRDSRIKYHRHAENIGMMANYRYALSRINTPFFSLLSDDDYLLPGFYETALKGFEQFPDVAISACGVKAINENGELVSDPMSIWQRVGYFAPQEGVTEMIFKPLLPPGILFRHQLVKDIHPDWEQDIQIRWDTDYLLQIFSRFSCVLNKTICAIFLAHEQGFSTGKYRLMQESAEQFYEHIVATEKMMHHMLECPIISSAFKENVKQKFLTEIKKDYYNHIILYTNRKKFTEASHAIKMYKEKYKVDKKILLLSIARWLYKELPWFAPFARIGLHQYRWARQCIRSLLISKTGRY
jgi:hypothetical protein